MKLKTRPAGADVDREVSVPTLVVEGTSVRFGALQALDNVSLTVTSGSIVGLVGPNGAGKSTLFSVVTGLLVPDAGRVSIEGRDISGWPASRRARLGMARTFQHPQLFGEMTVRDHVILADRMATAPRRWWSDALTGAGFRKASPEETSRAEAVLELCGLTVLGEAPVAGLPVGISRLVELARALATRPRLLLLDEAASGLNRYERDDVMRALRHIVDGGDLAVLLVEHDVDMVMSVADYIYVLNFGACIAGGTPSEVRRDNAVRQAYLGDLGDTQ